MNKAARIKSVLFVCLIGSLIALTPAIVIIILDFLFPCKEVNPFVSCQWGWVIIGFYGSIVSWIISKLWIYLEFQKLKIKRKVLIIFMGVITGILLYLILLSIEGEFIFNNLILIPILFIPEITFVYTIYFLLFEEYLPNQLKYKKR